MVDILQIAIQSVMRSALYALVALGFTLIFGVGGVLNLAHGASIAIGAYSAWFAISVLGLGLPGGFAAALVVPALFGGVMYLGMIRRFEHEPIMVMILTLVVSVAAETLFLNTAGAQSKAIPNLVSGNTIIQGTRVNNNAIAVFVLSWIIIIGLFLFINRTRQGKAIMATSMSDKGAALVGIDSGRINLGTWVIAGGLAGVAGLFLGSQLTATPIMGRNPLVLSFSIVVLGGIGSIKGSVVGAYLIGTLEVTVLSVVNPQLQGLMPLVVLIVVLLVKPEGLFGRELAE